MHIVSDPSLRRPGYIYNSHGIGYPAASRPFIVWNHIDGPLLHARASTTLTAWRENTGRKSRPHLRKLRASHELRQRHRLPGWILTGGSQ